MVIQHKGAKLEVNKVVAEAPAQHVCSGCQKDFKVVIYVVQPFMYSVSE